MILCLILFLPLLGGLLAWVVAAHGPYDGRRNDLLSRWLSVTALAVDLLLGVILWLNSSQGSVKQSTWLAEINMPWITTFGINFSLALDGISLLLILLTLFLGITAVVASWKEIERQTGFFHFNLLASLTGIIGVFLAMDLFFFYFFWEIMLVPVYFLIAIWGHERRNYAATKFFIFTQLSGLLMLAAILGLYFVHGRHTGTYTFDYFQLLNTPVPEGMGLLFLTGFLAAFLVKLPAIPFHTWLPDAHTEAPTAGSVILAGLLLKTGGYGLIRFAVPLFPAAAQQISPYAMAIGAAGIIYGAVLAFAQTDIKRLIAYTSISHMGFVILGIFAWNTICLQGVIIQMLSHGISTGALFILAGALQKRIGTREMQNMGGLWDIAPRMGGVWLFFALASLGLPGMGNFIGEFLILLGAYRVSVPLTVLAAGGLIVSTIYAVYMVGKTFFGERKSESKFPDLGKSEMTVAFAMMILLLWIGLYPQTFLNTAQPGISGIHKVVRPVLVINTDFIKGVDNRDRP